MIAEIEFEITKKRFASALPTLKVGDYVLCRVEKGEDIGKVVNLFAKAKPSTRIIRIALSEDMDYYREIKEEEKSVSVMIKEMAKDLGLPMRIIEVHIQFDRKVTRVYFLAETRIELKSLIKKLGKELNMRIELTQIGARDFAKRFGAYGVCGRRTCCSLFLKEFAPITLSLIRLQKLASGSSRLTGICGRLMCCLDYEKEFYKESNKKFPEIGSSVRTSDGTGTVVSWEIFKDLVNVRFENGKTEKVSLDELEKM